MTTSRAPSRASPEVLHQHDVVLVLDRVVEKPPEVGGDREPPSGRLLDLPEPSYLPGVGIVVLHHGPDHSPLHGVVVVVQVADPVANDLPHGRGHAVEDLFLRATRDRHSPQAEAQLAPANAFREVDEPAVRRLGGHRPATGRELHGLAALGRHPVYLGGARPIG